MATLEQVEKVRQKVDCTYEEARVALEECGDDLLEAIILLEKQGKRSVGGSGSYSTKEGNTGSNSHHSEQHSTTHTTYTRSENTFGSSVDSFFAWVGKMIKQGLVNYIDIINHEKIVLSIPLLIFVLLMVFCFWFMIPAMIIGLFCGLRYRFRGSDFENSKANDFMDSAADAAQNAGRKVRGDRDNDGSDGDDE